MSVSRVLKGFASPIGTLSTWRLPLRSINSLILMSLIIPISGCAYRVVASSITRPRASIQSGSSSCSQTLVHLYACAAARRRRRCQISRFLLVSCHCVMSGRDFWMSPVLKRMLLNVVMILKVGSCSADASMQVPAGLQPTDKANSRTTLSLQ